MSGSASRRPAQTRPKKSRTVGRPEPGTALREAENPHDATIADDAIGVQGQESESRVGIAAPLDERNLPLDGPIGYYDTRLDDEKAALKRDLDRERDRLRRSPELLHAFCQHAVGRSIIAAAKGDFVAAEIALEVTTLWADRKNDRYKSQPWTKNPSLFVRHVYKQWYDAGVLNRSHLYSDKLLYYAYLKHVKRHPADDLKLPAEPRTPIENPVNYLESKRARDVRLKSIKRKALP